MNMRNAILSFKKSQIESSKRNHSYSNNENKTDELQKHSFLNISGN